VSTHLCLIEARLHLGRSQDLKGKRKQLHSLKAQLRRRFSISVAEVDGHDSWQRSTLVLALVGTGSLAGRADEVERFIRSRLPGDSWAFERIHRSLEDLRD
jgi:uncharacterized protein YlxP (DUF503 family)